MELNAAKLLPIGSVVLVKEANKKMMVIGIMQENKGVRYEYMGVLYPEGYLDQQHVYLFNHEDIAEISFVGFMNAEHQVFRTKLDEILDEMK